MLLGLEQGDWERFDYMAGLPASVKSIQMGTFRPLVFVSEKIVQVSWHICLRSLLI
jgi:hypothetical protein